MARDIRADLKKASEQLRTNGPYIAQMVRMVHEYAEQSEGSAKGSTEEVHAIKAMTTALDALEVATRSVRQMGLRLAEARQAAEEAEQRRAEQRRKLKI
jgi:4-hydroxyphenylpyruvate dioxygenase-like putative hemolysin